MNSSIETCQLSRACLADLGGGRIWAKDFSLDITNISKARILSFSLWQLGDGMRKGVCLFD